MFGDGPIGEDVSSMHGAGVDNLTSHLETFWLSISVIIVTREAYEFTYCCWMLDLPWCTQLNIM